MNGLATCSNVGDLDGVMLSDLHEAAEKGKCCIKQQNQNRNRDGRVGYPEGRGMGQGGEGNLINNIVISFHSDR